MFKKGKRIASALTFLTTLLILVSVIHLQTSVCLADNQASDRASLGEPAVHTAMTTTGHDGSADAPAYVMASTHFEPFLLLLLGSTLMSIATAIKVYSSRKLKPKSKMF